MRNTFCSFIELFDIMKRANTTWSCYNRSLSWITSPDSSHRSPVGQAVAAAAAAAAGGKKGTGRLKSLPIDSIPEGPRLLPFAHGIDLDIPARKHASFSVGDLTRSWIICNAEENILCANTYHRVNYAMCY